jgi:hypothetical protein
MSHEERIEAAIREALEQPDSQPMTGAEFLRTLDDTWPQPMPPPYPGDDEGQDKP